MAGPWEQYQAAEGPWSKYKGGGLAPMNVDPTEGMSTFDKLAAGAGKAITDLGRGAGQWLGVVDRKDVEESRRLDKALMDTGAGKAGNIAGSLAMLAPTAMIPGANTLAGAGAIGAITGAFQPSSSTGETLANIGLGGVGGAGGQAIANKAAPMLSNMMAKRAADAQAQAQRLGAAGMAKDAGYVIPPADVNSSGLFEALNGLSGKIKTAQEASAKNQPVTNALAKKALGIADDAPLNADALLGIRSTAGDAYKKIQGIGEVKTDASYTKALDSIASKYQGAARSFPGAAKDEITPMVTALKQEKFDAGDAIDMLKVLRESADKAYRAGDTGMGKASKEAAKAIEDQLERHLTATGDKAALEAFRKARKDIAKTYSVQKALNAETGDVNAQALAKELAKGKPLSDELLTIAKAGQAFPKATQALKEAPKTFSPLDFFGATMTGAASGGNPLSLAMLAARPTARAALLSKPMQNMMMRELPQARLGERSLGLLSNDDLMRNLGATGLLGAYGSQQ